MRAEARVAKEQEARHVGKLAGLAWWTECGNKGMDH